MNIFYLYVSPRRENEILYQKGEYPDTLFYGLPYLRAIGHKVAYSDKAFSRNNLLRYFFYPIDRLFVWATSYGFKLDQAVILLSELNKNDVIVACGISAGLPLGLLKAIGVLKKPVICIQMGGTEKVRNSLIARFLKFFYSHLDKIVFFSLSEKQLVVERLNLSPKQTVFMPLGIDTIFFKPKKTDCKDYFLSVGRDLSRDFKFILEVFGEVKLPLKIVTSRRNLAGLDIPSNVEVLYDIPYPKLRELYNESRAVVLTMQPLQKAGGQLVFLESLAMSKPVIATNAPGLLSGYEDLAKVAHIVNYGDREGFTGYLRNLNDNIGIAGRKLVESKYNSKELAKNLADLVRQYEK